MDDTALLASLRARMMDPTTRTDVKVTPSPPVYSPASPELVAATEHRLGFSLHPFLRRIYMQVADGGFGPGYGLLRLMSSDQGLGHSSLSSVYLEFRDGGWPEKLLPLWDWGCAAWSCLDATSTEGIIVTHDDVVGATETAFTLRSWLRAWVVGVNMWNEIYEDRDATIMNPFTKKPVSTKAYGTAKGKRWSPRGNV